MTDPPKETTPGEATPGPGLSRRTSTRDGLWLAYSTTAPNCAAPGWHGVRYSESRAKLAVATESVTKLASFQGFCLHKPCTQRR